MYIIKGMIKMTIGIILTATVLVVLFPTDLYSDKCYFDSTYGEGLNSILVGDVISDSVLKYAKYEGASANGYLVSSNEVGDGTWVVEVNASLKAKNAFGVYSYTEYTVKAKLFCQGHSTISITKK